MKEDPCMDVPGLNAHAGERLEYLAHLFYEKDKEYGATYRRCGEVLLSIFPKGINLNSKHEMTRFMHLVMIITKVTRYANQFEKGAIHRDSLDDLAVYAMMLQEVDDMSCTHPDDYARSNET